MDEDIVKAALGNHNILITGQAGTGKTSIIGRLSAQLARAHKTCHLTATTGIATTVLPTGAATVHKLFGLLDGRCTTPQLISRICTDENHSSVKVKILTTDTVIIDEVSMLSLKILQQIDDLCRAVRKIDIPFGGIQLILVGDFFQLKPVPNTRYGDAGDYMLEYWKGHVFHMKTVYRQTEDKLIAAVHELGRGEVSPSTRDFLCGLKRPLPPGDPALKLFALNYDVDKHNSDKLMEMQGEMKTYTSIDTGHTKLSQVPTALFLKVDAPVMLGVKLTSTLVNGLCGVVTQLHTDSVEVLFPSVNKSTVIERYNFTIYDREKAIDIACRSQIPLRLAFALTVHKSQGLTLDRVEVDCRHMRNPGQIGVAVGRVRNSEGLRVLHFKDSLVKKQPQHVYDFYERDSLELKEDLSCCRPVQTIKDLHCPSPLDNETNQNSVEHISDDDGDDDDGDDDNGDIGELEKFEELFGEWDTDIPACNIDLKTILRSQLYLHPNTSQQTELNSVVQRLVEDTTTTQHFANKIWNIFTIFFKETVPQEHDEKVENKHITGYYKKIATFLGNVEYVSCVRELFQENELTATQYRAAFGIVECVRQAIVDTAAKPIIMVAKEKANEKARTKDSKGGRAKVRYIGGWCVATMRHRKKLFVRRNLFKRSTKLKVDTIDNEIKSLDQLIEDEDTLMNTSNDKESLIEIQRKQNAKGSLTNITDSAYKFFVLLDDKVQEIETIANLNIHATDFYRHIQKELENSSEIREHWKCLFADEDDDMIGDTLPIANTLINEVIGKYLRMSSSDFRKEYKRKLNIEKQEAHRKQIRMREERKPKARAFDMSSIFEDSSDRKRKSHLRLQSEILGNDKVLVSFTRDNLLKLVNAYDVKASKKMNKGELIGLLCNTISTAERIQHPEMLEKVGTRSIVQDAATEPTPTVSRKRIAAASGRGKGKRKKTAVNDYPCGICGINCLELCVCCDLCDRWYHFDCLKVTGDEKEFANDWYCNNCNDT